MTRLCLCGLPLVALLVLTPPTAARADDGPAVVRPDEAQGANPAPAPAGEEPPQAVPLWVWAGGAIAAALFAVGLMIRLGMNQSPPARLEFPRTFSRADLPPDAPPEEEYYPDDPSAQQQS